jgi:hypothetical protein
VDLEARVGKDHPLRTIRGIVNEALRALSGEFSTLYARMGRPSIPPEKLLRAMLLQAFYSIRSERQLMERLEFDLLFRWFVGLGVVFAALLMGFHNGRDGRCFPSYDRICAAAGCCRQTVPPP